MLLFFRRYGNGKEKEEKQIKTKENGKITKERMQVVTMAESTARYLSKGRGHPYGALARKNQRSK